jgi:hypothetical protein
MPRSIPPPSGERPTTIAIGVTPFLAARDCTKAQPLISRYPPSTSTSTSTATAPRFRPAPLPPYGFINPTGAIQITAPR